MSRKIVDSNGEVKRQKLDTCGCFGFSPPWLRKLAIFPVYMLILCGNAILQGMMVNGFISTSISSIERRFSLTSTKSGIFSATYDVAVAFVLFPLSWMATRVNKVRSIGQGMMLVGVGALMLCIPQFLEGQYQVGQLKFDHCDTNRTTLCDESQATNSLSFPLLILSQIFIGIGAAPLFTYGYSTIDEFDAHTRTGTNMAIFMGVSTVGPALAFIGGGQLLKIWGDIGKTNPSDLGISGPEDPRWYGAWWIGFAAAGLLSFFTALPLLMFPKKLNDTDERKKKDTIQTHASLNVDFSGEKWEQLKTFKLFLMNPTCMALIAMQTFESMIMNGYITFIPKVFENLFGLTSSWSSTVTGILVIPMGIIGSYIGGKAGEMVGNKVPKLFKMTMACVVMNAICACCLLLNCPEREVAGINVSYKDENPFGIDATCNSMCNCKNIFNPVCNKMNNVSYLSPCHAGCQAASDAILGNKWDSCGCAAERGIGNRVEKGWCGKDCGLLQYVFFGLFALMACFTFACAPLVQSAALRVVSFKHRDAFICFGWMWMRVLGSIPGAIAFGALIDTSCTQWIEGCDGSKKCVLYNARDLSHYIFYLTLCTKLCCFTALLIACKHYKPVPDCDDPTLKLEDMKFDDQFDPKNQQFEE
ncbi:unnamed protein product, partial [Mesorhabditis belari]|uniref:Solute carrier organic anion transporter family member n=1 Tax=Mesorhabditis belari TaxID=2138241 RepID=A0AAF3F675_9BILA